jgi:hypothetical protein
MTSIQIQLFVFFFLFVTAWAVGFLLLKRLIDGLSNSFEWDFSMRMYSHVILGDRLAVIVPSHFTAF